jgi:hypothetical protein
MESLMEFLSRTQPPVNDDSSRGEPDFTKLQTTSSGQRSATAVARSGGGHNVEHNHAVNHLVRGLIVLLPKTDSIWRPEDRVKWLRLAADIFEVGYKTGDSVPSEISIVAVKQVSAKSKE